MKVPCCYSGNPVLSRLGRHHSRQIYEDIQRYVAKESVGKTNANVDPSLVLKGQDVMRWRADLKYTAFWIDGGDIGVMIHPITHVPVWLNEVAMSICRLMDGSSSIADILNTTQNKEIGPQRHEDVVGFLLLLEDLDMITIKRALND